MNTYVNNCFWKPFVQMNLLCIVVALSIPLVLVPGTGNFGKIAPDYLNPTRKCGIQFLCSIVWRLNYFPFLFSRDTKTDHQTSGSDSKGQRELSHNEWKIGGNDEIHQNKCIGTVLKFATYISCSTSSGLE